MTTLTEAIYTHLSTDAGILAAVSTRVYPVQMPQIPTLPAITFTRISTTPTQTRDSAKPTHSRPRYQFDVWATTWDSLDSVRATLRTAIGTIAQSTTPRIDVALLQNDFELVEPETGNWHAILDYYVWHAEP